MPKTENNHHGCTYTHYKHPGTGDTECVLERPGQEDQPAVGHDLSDIEEGSLPTDISALGAIVEGRHIDAIGSDVVGGSAKSNQQHKSNTVTEKIGQRETESDQRKADTGYHLCAHHKVFFCLEQFKKGTPKGLQAPWEDYKRGPEGDRSVADTHI